METTEEANDFMNSVEGDTDGYENALDRMRSRNSGVVGTWTAEPTQGKKKKRKPVPWTPID